MAEHSRDVARAVACCAERRDADSLRALYDCCARSAAPMVTERVREALEHEGRIGAAFLREVGRWLMRSSPHVEPVRLGMALVGRAGDATDVANLKLLSRCDRLVHEALDAVRRLLPDPIDAVWEMARYDVRGSLGLVEELIKLLEHAAGDRPDIRDWLLRHGCPDSELAEEVACTCAEVGRLATAVDSDTIDAELLDGACVIVEGMMDAERSSSFRGLDHYPTGVEVVRRLLSHIERAAGSMACLTLLARAHSWLDAPLPSNVPAVQRWVPLEPFRDADAEDDVDNGEAEKQEGDTDWRDRVEQHWAGRWERRLAVGWTPEVRCELAQKCERLLVLPRWPELVRRALDAEDGRMRGRAAMVAPVVGVDPWDQIHERLRSCPLDFNDFVHVISSPDEARAGRAMVLLEERLDLASLSNAYKGRRDAWITLGEDQYVWAAVAHMRPGAASDELIAAALRSGCVRVRQAALAALGRVAELQSSADIRAALREAIANEPEEKLRRRMSVVLGAGEA